MRAACAQQRSRWRTRKGKPPLHGVGSRNRHPPYGSGSVGAEPASEHTRRITAHAFSRCSVTDKDWNWVFRCIRLRACSPGASQGGACSQAVMWLSLQPELRSKTPGRCSARGQRLLPKLGRHWEGYAVRRGTRLLKASMAESRGRSWRGTASMATARAQLLQAAAPQRHKNWRALGTWTGSVVLVA